jgi:release factor glutamine methyltransferase
VADLAGLVARLRAAGCVFAEEEAALLLAAAGGGDAEPLVARRVAGEPLEHVVGHAVFHGLRIAVGPGVFVPRRRSEFLVARALAGAPAKGAITLLDLCCGSGALGLALRTALGERARLHAADVDPGALRWARRNLAPVGAAVYEGDLYAPLPPALRERVDILTANVPYVPTGEVRLLPAEARAHEPLVALDGGADGLALVRRVAHEAPRWLAPGGRLLVESGERQAAQVAAVFTAAGLRAEVAHEEEGWATVVTGTRPGRPRTP